MSELSQAVSICAEDGSKLPLPKNSQENSDIVSFFKTKSTLSIKNSIYPMIALDLNDAKNEGTFVSSTGNEPIYTNWDNKEA